MPPHSLYALGQDVKKVVSQDIVSEASRENLWKGEIMSFFMQWHQLAIIAQTSNTTPSKWVQKPGEVLRSLYFDQTIVYKNDTEKPKQVWFQFLYTFFKSLFSWCDIPPLCQHGLGPRAASMSLAHPHRQPCKDWGKLLQHKEKQTPKDYRWELSNLGEKNNISILGSFLYFEDLQLSKKQQRSKEKGRQETTQTYNSKSMPNVPTVLHGANTIQNHSCYNHTNLSFAAFWLSKNFLMCAETKHFATRSVWLAFFL